LGVLFFFTLSSTRLAHYIGPLFPAAALLTATYWHRSLFDQDTKGRRASIHTMGGFSAHGGQNDLLEWFDTVAPSRPRLFITHGDDRARKVFSDLVRTKHGLDPECPQLGDVIEI